MLDYAGWRFVLEPQKMGRILCVGAISESVVLSISQICHQLLVVYFGSSVLQVVRQELGSRDLAKISYIKASEDKISLPFPDEHFDGFIFSSFDQSLLPKAVLAAPNAFSALHLFFSEIYRVLKRDGFIYFGLENKYGYDKLANLLLRRSASNKSYTRFDDHVFSFGKLKCAAYKAGFKHVKSYKLLTDEGVVREIVLGRTYEPSKNSFLFKEKIKQLILGGPVSNFLVPSLAFLCFKGQPGPNYLDELVRDLIKKGILSNGCGEAFVVKRYLILPGKVILSVGQLQQPYGNYIVVLPFFASVLDRLRHEARILQLLHRGCLHFLSLVPRFFLEDQFYDQAYFVQQEMPGTSIDAPVSLLDQITWRALQILIDFHRETLQEATLTEDLFSVLFSNPLHRVVQKIGTPAALPIDNIDTVLRVALVGKPFKTVWMHGDFKIENLMIDPKNLEINGIIDWDLSKEIGLPFLDLLYLLAYNRVIREEKSIEQILLDYIIPEKWSRFERTAQEEYFRSLNIGMDFAELLMFMFWIYHIAYRIEIYPRTNELIEKMLLVLKAFEKIIENFIAKLSLG